jgi:hypothetical protein
MTHCLNCQQPLRAGAQFCTRCGAASAAPVQPDALSRMRQAAAQAGSSAAPVVIDTAAKGWQVSRRKMGRLAGILTLGGRAAYTEIASPQVALEGFVVSPPTPAWSPPVREPAAYLFMAVLLAIWLLLLLPPLAGLVAWLGLLVALLALAWAGARRPYFSRLTFRVLWQRLRRRPASVAALTFSVQHQSAPGRPPVVVTVLGYDPQGALSANTFVRVYGIFSADGKNLRAWKVLTTDSNGRLAGALTAPRLLPLVVALLLSIFTVIPGMLIRLLGVI